MLLRRVLVTLVFVDAFLASLLVTGCQKEAASQREAANGDNQAIASTALATKSPAEAQPTPTKPASDATPTAAGAKGDASCEEGKDCGGNCNQWDEAAAKVAKRSIPENAKWDTFKVSGMHCGGCERRVIANLGKLSGVVSVEADAELGQVRVASISDAKVHDTAAQTIESLGYQIVR